MARENSEGKGEAYLIQRIREGDECAFEIAYLKYYTPLCRYIWKYVRSEGLSKEIIQEVFADVWECRKKLDPAGHLRRFLYDVSKNKALDYIKHKKIVNQYISETKYTKKEKIKPHFYTESSENKEFVEAVEDSIQDLPPRGRQIFELNRNEGLTYKEISEYLDISIKTVETHMRRSLRKLRDNLSKFVSLLLIDSILWHLYCFL